MITDRQRRLVRLMVWARLWKVQRSLFDVWQVYPQFQWTRWLFEKLLREQPQDPKWHAPACPANMWSGRALVLERCTCGAASSDNCK